MRNVVLMGYVADSARGICDHGRNLCVLVRVLDCTPAASNESNAEPERAHQILCILFVAGGLVGVHRCGDGPLRAAGIEWYVTPDMRVLLRQYAIANGSMLLVQRRRSCTSWHCSISFQQQWQSSMCLTNAGSTAIPSRLSMN
jgi:hypothetical protein